MSLTVKLNNKFQAQQSVINLSHNMRVFSWICLRQVFVKRNSCNPWYGSDKMIFSLYGRMERKNLKIFWKVLMNLIPALNLPMNPIKKVRVSWYKSKFKKRQVFFTDGYVKPSDRHQYLRYLSAHQYHTEKSVAFSQSLRISRLCNSEKDLENQEEEMKSWFRKREYPEDLINAEVSKVKFFNLRIVTGKKHPKIKLQRWRKIRIWTFGLLVHQINSF